MLTLSPISSITILKAQAEHESGWRSLWSLYCGPGIEPSITDATWQRILDPSSSIGAYMALEGDHVIGFVTFVVHEGTWEVKPLCYVEDLYVAKSHRGDALGVGVMLIEALSARLKSGEWSRLYGVTRMNNQSAQRLYNRFAQGESYVRYVVKPSGPGNPQP